MVRLWYVRFTLESLQRMIGGSEREEEIKRERMREREKKKKREKRKKGEE